MTTSQSQPIIIEEAFKDSTQSKTFNKASLTKENQGDIVSSKQPQSSTNKLNENLKSKQIQLNEESFFKVMDLMDEYDKLLKQMNEEYCAGMLIIANVKFINPYTSLSTKGFKPTPAVVKVSTPNQQKQDRKPLSSSQYQNLFTLVQQTKNIKFTNSVIESINNQIQQNKNGRILNQHDDENTEILSQSAHSSISTANQLYSFEEEEIIMEEQEIIDDCRKHTDSDKFSLQEFILERFSIETQQSMVEEASIKFSNLLKRLLHLAERKLSILRQFEKLQKQHKQK